MVLTTPLPLDVRLVLGATGLFFLVGLLTGAWKYSHMLRTADHHAPMYVNIAHHAALHYSFASALLLPFGALSRFSVGVDTASAGMVLLFFTAAIATYVRLGVQQITDNQFQSRTWLTTWGMWALIGGEIGGFVVLAIGVAVGQLGG